MAEIAVWWLPIAAVVAVAGLGVAAAAAQPARPAKPYWVAALLLGGTLAIVLAARLQEIGRAALRGARAESGAAGSQVVALNARVKELESQLRVLQEKSRGRTIAPDAAAKIEERLRQAGSRRVVVSCVPGDVEAYDYANQIANLLRAAGWEALGPEATQIFGEAPAMGVRLYVRSGTAPPDAATILIDAFTRFNIPFESGITPSAAIPDPATTEIFVSRKP
ncbi:MAG TPA: hypothetical protein VKQ73_17620 [Stellaceae bacterium]|nr:hypothetical protein [Stellaceae bacterium]